MKSFFGTLKIWLAVLLLLCAVMTLVVPLLNSQFSLTYLFGSLAITFYSYCMFYSGRTQRKNQTVDKPIIIWFEILYGGFCLCYYIYDSVVNGRFQFNSTFIAFIVITAVTVQDIFRMTKKNEEPD